VRLKALDWFDRWLDVGMDYKCGRHHMGLTFACSQLEPCLGDCYILVGRHSITPMEKRRPPDGSSAHRTAGGLNAQKPDRVAS
jgi:hypothetical protein